MIVAGGGAEADSGGPELGGVEREVDELFEGCAARVGGNLGQVAADGLREVRRGHHDVTVGPDVGGAGHGYQRTGTGYWAMAASGVTIVIP